MTVLALANEAADISMTVRAQGAGGGDTSSALEKLVKYIPAEVVTLYVAALGAMPTIQNAISGADAKWAFWISVGATPLLCLIVFGGKRRAGGQSPFPGLRDWPWWGMFSATVAFLLWGCTVPSSAYLTSESAKVIAAFGAVLASTLLSVLEPLLGPK